MPDKISTKSKLITNGIALFLVVLLYGGLWYWGYHTLGILGEKQSTTNDSGETSINVEEAALVLSTSKDIQTQVNTYVLTTDEVVGFIEHLEDLARDSGLQETTDAVSDTTFPGLTASEWGGLQVVVTTKGSWHNTYQFLSLLERIPYRSTTVQSVIEQYTDPNEKEKILGWKGEFTIKVLRKK